MIVGDGPLGDALQAQITAARLQDHVELAGPRPQEQLAVLLGKASLFALPCVVTASGDRDGLPTVLLEALAAGLPCVSTNVAGIPEIIEHGTCGLLTEPNSPVQLAGAIKTLLASPDLRERFSAAGRQKAELDFDVVKSAARLAALFRRHAKPDAAHKSGDHDEHRLRVS